MKGSSRYSKSTHKKSIDSTEDPYLPKLAPGGAGECKKCSVVYWGKRWWLAEEFEEKKPKNKPTEKILCPACQKKRDGIAGGYITISGDFVDDHKGDIIGMIRNKEGIAMRKNPLERLIDIKEKTGIIDVTTTTDKFAERIGQMLKKTFSGEVEYKWSADEKLVRVKWNR